MRQLKVLHFLDAHILLFITGCYIDMHQKYAPKRANESA
jgi:hypothetical protein